MDFLRFARRSKDVRAAVQSMQDHGIEVAGPYRTPKDTPIFTLADAVVTERELLDLSNSGKLDATGVSEFTARTMQRQTN